MSASEDTQLGGSSAELLRKAASAMAGQIGVAALAFVAAVLSARSLAPSGRGELALLMLVPLILTAFLDPGQESAASHLVSRSRDAAPRIQAGVLAIAVVAFAIASAALATVYPVLPLTTPLPISVALGAFGTSMLILNRGLGGIALGLGRIRLYNTGRLSSTAVWLAAVAVLWAKSETSPVAFLLVWDVSLMTSAGLVALALRIAPVLPARETLLHQVRVGAKMQIGLLGQFLLSRIDQLLLAIIAGSSAAVGVYAVSTNVAEVLWYFPVAAAAVSIPILSRPTPLPERQAVFTITVASAFWLSLIGAVAVGVSAPVLVPAVFGESFSTAVSPLLLLLPGVIGVSIYRVSIASLLVVGRSRSIALIPIIPLSLNIALNILLIPRWGVNGAAIASTVAYMLMGLHAVCLAAHSWGVSTVTAFLPSALKSGLRRA